ncbi:rhodanese-like domain-containing protein [Leptolyngbya sp. FACHB-711]|uniref:rhodanese-like domain-containing protein n=1 Tax=unclassified Leptolyngbya TaxID=2650499 RepID=UPI00168437DF|nr:rhodanese-like domain-containing protein [Leptolyngbya sp. FACHB-711]MBD1851905.1 rhodanese-like domain-containing protein [Cyanobacteria bacterium FACHB-502]MBD2023588.1 rhodanese-like domain-containing protein [Leptolyngbya sp. FACHB-711]
MVALPAWLRSLLWKLVKRSIRRKFPQVQPIDPATLTAQLQQEPKPVLLDVRSASEYAVSHLPAAQQIDPATKDFSDLPYPPDTSIVCYCSVGYRSARLCARLQAAGYQNVRNLEGSAFEWVNQGYPVYREEQRVRSIHPYNAQWGLLLDKADVEKTERELPP